MKCIEPLECTHTISFSLWIKEKYTVPLESPQIVFDLGRIKVISLCLSIHGLQGEINNDYYWINTSLPLKILNGISYNILFCLNLMGFSMVTSVLIFHHSWSKLFCKTFFPTVNDHNFSRLCPTIEIMVARNTFQFLVLTPK